MVLVSVQREFTDHLPRLSLEHSVGAKVTPTWHLFCRSSPCSERDTGGLSSDRKQRNIGPQKF